MKTIAWITITADQSQAALAGSSAPSHCEQLAAALFHQKPASHATPHGPPPPPTAGDEFWMARGQQ